MLKLLITFDPIVNICVIRHSLWCIFLSHAVMNEFPPFILSALNYRNEFFALCGFVVTVRFREERFFKSVSNYPLMALENGFLVIKDRSGKVRRGFNHMWSWEMVVIFVGVEYLWWFKLSVHIRAHFKKELLKWSETRRGPNSDACESIWREGKKRWQLKWIRDRNDIDLIVKKR